MAKKPMATLFVVQLSWRTSGKSTTIGTKMLNHSEASRESTAEGHRFGRIQLLSSEAREELIREASLETISVDGHPSELTWLRYNSHLCSEAEQSFLTDHLRSCMPCQRTTLSSPVPVYYCGQPFHPSNFVSSLQLSTHMRMLRHGFSTTQSASGQRDHEGVLSFIVPIKEEAAWFAAIEALLETMSRKAITFHMEGPTVAISIDRFSPGEKSLALHLQSDAVNKRTEALGGWQHALSMGYAPVFDPATGLYTGSWKKIAS